MWVFFICLGLLAISAPFLYNFVKTPFHLLTVNKKLSHFKKVPGYPIIENLLIFMSHKKILTNLLNVVKDHGKIIKINIFYGLSALMITDLKCIEFILSTYSILNKTLAYTFLFKWLGEGLLTSGGDKWKKTRKIITPAFHFKILEEYKNTFPAASNILIKKLRNQCGKGAFDVYPYITLCTLDIICESAMGVKVNAQEQENSEYVIGVREMCRIIVDRSLNPLKVFNFTYRFSKDYQKELHYLKILHGYTQSVINTRRAELLIPNKDKQVNRRSIAFLDLLLQAEMDGRPMTNYEIQQEVDTFMFEGHDTTASGISFALYCLATNPDVQQKVVEELKIVFGNDKNRPATFKELQEMRYLEMVIKESLRLYPSVPIYGRMPVHDVYYNNALLPVGAQLGIFAYGVHRDPDVYPDPERFDPDRFLPENQATRHPFSYLAFSAGPRNCIGQKFAMLEMKNILSHILRNFVLKMVPNYKPEVVALTVLKSLNGILIQLEERD